jgi:hypothetical protein
LCHQSVLLLVVVKTDRQYQIGSHHFMQACRKDTIVQMPETAYLSGLGERARSLGLRQEEREAAVGWVSPSGALQVLFFRIPNPGDLNAIRDMYDAVGAIGCPLAYAFVQQVGDGKDTWDVFQLSAVSYLAHCNRLSGPGSDSPNRSDDRTGG